MAKHGLLSSAHFEEEMQALEEKKQRQKVAENKIFFPLVVAAMQDGWRRSKYPAKAELLNGVARLSLKADFLDSDKQSTLETISGLMDGVEPKYLIKALKPYIYPYSVDHAGVTSKTDPQRYPIFVNHESMLKHQLAIAHNAKYPGELEVYTQIIKECFEGVVLTKEDLKTKQGKVLQKISSFFEKDSKGDLFLYELACSDPNFYTNTNGVEGVKVAAQNMANMLTDLARHQPKKLKEFFTSSSFGGPNIKYWTFRSEEKGGLYNQFFQLWNELIGSYKTQPVTLEEKKSHKSNAQSSSRTTEVPREPVKKERIEEEEPLIDLSGFADAPSFSHGHVSLPPVIPITPSRQPMQTPFNPFGLQFPEPIPSHAFVPMESYGKVSSPIASQSAPSISYGLASSPSLIPIAQYGQTPFNPFISQSTPSIPHGQVQSFSFVPPVLRTDWTSTIESQRQTAPLLSNSFVSLGAPTISHSEKVQTGTSNSSKDFFLI